jgi:A/G-specific adenine glycosylase
MTALVRASRDRIRRLRANLLVWYDANRRDLPWRRSRDPYAIWISESMLQQTRVETVIPYYARFLERFPDVHALASADREEVYKLWEGLGYYSRARNLHDAARMVVEEWQGELKPETEALRALPGVGRYTAGALASIAVDRPEPVVDGNVVRVLTRILGVRSDASLKPVVEHLWDEAGALARGPRPGDLNQALMELGATVCTPRSPRCNVCPVRRSCDARRRGDAESLPLKKKKPKPRTAEATAAWLPRRGTVLAVKRPPEGLLANLWELPGGEVAPGSAPEAELRRHLRERISLEIAHAEHVGEVRHVFTHLRLRLHVYRCSEPRGRVRLSGHPDHRWVGPADFGDLPHAALTRRALALLRER